MQVYEKKRKIPKKINMENDQNISFKLDSTNRFQKLLMLKQIW